MTICKHPECKKNASYNVIGLKARWCKTHKTTDMIDVAHKKCPCGKQSSFNLPGETMGICCAECKMPGMIDVKNKLCPCGKQPIFNLPGETVGICCTECKTPGMIDVMNKRCLCGTIPYFNLPGETVGICCKECKTSEMVNVKDKLCPCGTRPYFNLPGETVGFCCVECKTSEMVNVVSKRCPGYNGVECPVGYFLVSGCQYCLSCDPDDSRRETRKKYENAFFRHVQGKIDIKRREFVVKYNPNETTKKFSRLDGIVFGNDIIVCLEVDENGHESYACDKSRMHMVTAELLQQYPGVDVCWIRVNPTTKHKNPWGVAAKRVRAERFDAVIQSVNDVLKNKTTGVVYIGHQ
ncbi:hypothetical protein PBCVCVR1_017R [Paramecium bursaria Chlorella virus CVR-1]|uniref:Uncharacterized protein n=1 Tax=Paramecium bursaria Chlorella virus CVA-1 TaxID=42683 RepID=M1HL02_9PHYC|nr:hypothetical protein F8205_gp006 [Paramecium bursaria Chlorella virus CVA-1]AGE50361.1 hypothetical protein PBCVCVA1_013R [Paramecium bursaria Chlorella virus CVA-1]AGE52036.1 hypothetical protein PBCVCVR1_017R [Paramecium bursaria Chlorella virus CVR-1]